MDPAIDLQEAPVPGLDPVAAQRWRLQSRASSPWLHEEIGARMAERLNWIKQAPASWLDWSPLLGGLDLHRRLQERYPQAQAWLAGEQGAEARLALEAAASRAGWWQRSVRKWAGQSPRLVAPGALPPVPVDLVWANMALHHHARPRQLLAHWRELLQVGGFLMFSCLGPDTLREVRHVFAAQGWGAPHHPYTDMHDWGDMLVEVGFAEPVMDMERLTLVYENAQRLLQELRETGRNLSDQRFAGMRGRAFRHRLLDALEAGLPRTPQGQLQVTVEVVYGHAFKGAPRVKMAHSASVSEQDMRAMLRQGQGGR